MTRITFTDLRCSVHEQHDGIGHVFSTRVHKEPLMGRLGRGFGGSGYLHGHGHFYQCVHKISNLDKFCGISSVPDFSVVALFSYHRVWMVLG